MSLVCFLIVYCSHYIIYLNVYQICILLSGMVFNVSVGFSDIPVSEGKKVALFIGDTVQVNDVS